jgi:hypothetical protein
MKTTRLLRLLPALLLGIPLFGLLGACSTSYRPPVVVRDSTPFPGIAGIVAASGKTPVDLILVHGMCTQDASWAERAIDRIAGVVTAHAPPRTPAPAAAAGGIQLVERTLPVGAGSVRFHGLVWSPLTAELKRQLDYDNTGSPTDCAGGGVCKPARARFNGSVKDRLLNDCLADAMIYQGHSHGVIRDAMVETLSRIIESNPDGDSTLVVVAESLGSKMLFDALTSMLESNRPRTQALGQQAARRLGLIYMAGNQLPILGLAEQGVVARAMPPQDALQRFLELRRRQPGHRTESIQRLAVVAFTDPNDLLSYRLLPARYAAPDVAVADVLVSNDKAWLGLLENPVAAHLGYLNNPDVGALIACGWPRQRVCD